MSAFKLNKTLFIVLCLAVALSLVFTPATARARSENDFAAIDAYVESQRTASRCLPCSCSIPNLPMA